MSAILENYVEMMMADPDGRTEYLVEFADPASCAIVFERETRAEHGRTCTGCILCFDPILDTEI